MDRHPPHHATRRRVLGTGAGAALLLGLDPLAVLADDAVLRRKIPSTGELLPAIGLGTGGSTGETYRADTAEARASLDAVVKAMLAAGATLIDTASTYGDAEAVIGSVVAQNKLRDRVFIATKMEATEPKAGAAELQRSLKRLQVTKVDLVQLHNVRDPQQSLAMFRQFKAEGLTRTFGVTSTFPEDYAAMEAVVRREKPEFMEVGYSIGDRQAEERLLPAAADAGAAVLAAQPVGGGRSPLFKLVKGKALPPIAGEIGAASWAQFFLKYVLSHPAVTAAIPGTTSVGHMEDDLGAMRGRLPDAGERRTMAATFDAMR